MKYLLKISSISLLVTFWVFSEPVKKTMIRLPDTGETSGFTEIYGEDADYNINPPGFILNGSGIATDTITGLMWQSSDGGEMTFEKATVYCESLTLGGFSDWRLPSVHELFSIINLQFSNPALNVSVFPKSSAEYWWSGTVQWNDASKVWVTNSGGGVGNHGKAETIGAGGSKRYHVRAVRDPVAPQSLENQFTDNGNGTITDHLTGLVWQKKPAEEALNWEKSLIYAESLALGGFRDWRLPNIKELRSISEESKSNPSVDTNYFTIAGAKKFWASTTLPNQAARAWYWDTQYGITSHADKTAGHLVLAVRGGNENSSNLMRSPKSSNKTQFHRINRKKWNGLKIPLSSKSQDEFTTLLGRIQAY